MGYKGGRYDADPKVYGDIIGGRTQGVHPPQLPSCSSPNGREVFDAPLS